ncbi:hypothetical protein GQ42DRAFT_160992 [Ramicandelaber brevisporus]|nr:hypothetical protein GQ42DRAFT_160992 [Ramicandelaber brevisporus]
MRRCVCAFGCCCCLACSLSLPHNHHTTLSTNTYIFFLKILSSTGVVPSLSPGAAGVLARCSVPVVVVPLPPGCGMFHLFPSLLVRPSSAGFLPHLLLAVVGRRCHQVKVVALAVSTLFPRCCRHAMFFLVNNG